MTLIKWLIPCGLAIVLFSCGERRQEKNADLSASTRDSAATRGTETANNFAAVDVSPMDMSYFPVDYPKIRMTSSSEPPPLLRVVYSRPHLQGRRLFPDILKHGEPWRLGANEATELTVYKDLKIESATVKAGRYTLYCIPQLSRWTIVLNSNTDTWGLKQDSTLDVHRFDIPISTGNPSLEYFTLVFEKTAKGADLVIAWDDVIGRLPFLTGQNK